jgi:hypothetical protein
MPSGAVPTQNGKPVLITREEWEACCCGSSGSSSGSSGEVLPNCPCGDFDNGTDSPPFDFVTLTLEVEDLGCSDCGSLAGPWVLPWATCGLDGTGNWQSAIWFDSFQVNAGLEVHIWYMWNKLKESNSATAPNGILSRAVVIIYDSNTGCVSSSTTGFFAYNGSLPTGQYVPTGFCPDTIPPDGLIPRSPANSGLVCGGHCKLLSAFVEYAA